MAGYFAKSSAQSYAARGGHYLKKGLHEKAAASFGKALARDPENADAHAGRAAALLGLGRVEDALAHCNRAIALDAECAAAYRVRAAIHQQGGRAEEAAADLEAGRRAAARGPEGFRAALAALTPRLLITPALVAINLVVFGLMVASGVDAAEPEIADLVRWGAGLTALSVEGEWWRLLTATFVHIGFLHVAFNMWVLWDAGRLVERVFGNAGFLVLYVASGLVGSLASNLLNPDVVCAGASGAVFGVYGALLGFLVRCRGSIPKKVLAGLSKSGVAFLGYNLFYGFMHAGIDVAAHVGGLAAGFACGLVMAQPLSRKALAGRRARNLLVGVGAALLVAAGAGVVASQGAGRGGAEGLGGLESLRPMSEAAGRELNQAMAYLDQGQHQRAITRLDRAIQLEPKHPLLHAIRGDAYLAKGDWDRAIADFDEAVRLAPKFAIAYSDRAAAHIAKEDWARAVADCDAAIRLEPTLAFAYANRAVAYSGAGQADKAIADCDKALGLEPDFAQAYANRGEARVLKGDYARAIADCAQAIELDPTTGSAYLHRGVALGHQGEHEKAAADLKQAVTLDPLGWLAQERLAWLLATCPKDALRDGVAAVTLATQACEVTKWRRPRYLETLAAACAEAGRFADAVKWQKQAIESPAYPQGELAAARKRLELYEAGKPHREEKPNGGKAG